MFCDHCLENHEEFIDPETQSPDMLDLIIEDEAQIFYDEMIING